MRKTFHLRLTPTKEQRRAFAAILEDSCETYNAALQERKEAWRLERKSISYEDQCAELAELRKDERFSRIASYIQREPLRRIDHAFKEFFRRCKSGEKPGYPRFKSPHRYQSFAWNEPRVYEKTFLVPKLGLVKFKAHRRIAGTPKQVIIKKVGVSWIAKVSCDCGPAPEKCTVKNPIGIDLGLTALATLSDGSSIPNPRWTKKHASAIARAQRGLARKKRGSSNCLKAKEQLRRTYQKMANARSNYCHHVSKAIVSKYDLVAHEKLDIMPMAQMRRAGMTKSIMDAAWSQLIRQITYKAEYAGKWAVPVNPRGTTQTCSSCGAVAKKKLSERTHSCPCGLVLGRDHNAGINIMNLALKKSGRDFVGFLTEEELSSLPR